MRSTIYMIAALAVVPMAIVLAAPQQQVQMHNMNTNIAFGTQAEKVSSTSGDYNGQVLIDPSRLIDQVSKSKLLNDIEEDPEDRFITTRSGKPRQSLMRGKEADQWVEDTLAGQQQVAAGQKVLSRKKRRCGGGNNDGDGNANRARRARAQRRAVARRAERKAARKAARRAQSTTTVIRKIVPISELNQMNGVTTIQQQQPGVIVQSAQPAAATTVQQPAQVIQQQVPQQQVVAAPVAATAAAPVVAAAPAAAPAVAAPGLPSIAVQGSVKIN